MGAWPKVRTMKVSPNSPETLQPLPDALVRSSSLESSQPRTWPHHQRQWEPAQGSSHLTYLLQISHYYRRRRADLWPVFRP